MKLSPQCHNALRFLFFISVAHGSLFSIINQLWSAIMHTPLPSIFYPEGPQVTLANKDIIVGTNEGLSSLQSFLGIPFAAPPIGDLRFRYPQPYTKSLNGFHAKAFGPSCPMQNPATSYSKNLPLEVMDLLMMTPLFQDIVPTSEDCLTLNVYRRRGLTPDSKLPVMVWIFGGGFELGSSSTYLPHQMMDQAKKMGKEFVFVSMNYRLASLGFLGGKEIKGEGSGNAGLLDQRKALEWVADNIGGFGGDPDKVTIFGESAGSISCAHQMIANGGDHTYKGKPLFRAAIMQSGSVLPVENIDAPFPQRIFDTVAGAAGCGSAADKLKCLRALPLKKMMDATNSVPSIASYYSLQLSFMPRADGGFIQYNGHDMIKDGKYAKVPYIIGDQEDEGTIFSIMNLNITTDAEVKTYIKNVFASASDSSIDELLVHYPSDPDAGSPFDSAALIENVLTPQNKRIAALLGDAVFQAPRRYFLQNTPQVKRYTYLSQQLKGLPIVGSFHANDIVWQWYLWGTGSYIYRNAFIAFAHSLDPNSGGLYTATKWPEYQTANSVANNMMYIHPLELGTGKDDFRKDPIAFWNNNYKSWLA